MEGAHAPTASQKQEQQTASRKKPSATGKHDIGVTPTSPRSKDSNFRVPRIFMQVLKVSGLRATSASASASSSASDREEEEDDDDLRCPVFPTATLGVPGNCSHESPPPTPAIGTLESAPVLATEGPSVVQTTVPREMAATHESVTGSSDRGTVSGEMPGKTSSVVVSVDAEMRDVIRRGLERDKGEGKAVPKSHRPMVFTKQFSAFDGNNPEAAASPFRGFYVLFWVFVALWVVKVGADNYRETGHVLGGNQIMKLMYSRDVLLLLFFDGIMCGSTGFSWILQRLVFKGSIDWDRSGWIVQHLWQATFLAGVVWLPHWRDWPWTHTAYFVLQGLTMLMKQHAYAFQNGHFSSIYRRRERLLAKVKKLESDRPVSQTAGNVKLSLPEASNSRLTHRRSASSKKEERQSKDARSLGNDDIKELSDAVDAGQQLDADQIELLRHLMQLEVEAIEDELRGGSTTPGRNYPNNLTALNHYEFIVLPTLIYELEYPRTDKINWAYVAQKTCGLVGIIIVMILVSQVYLYPVGVKAVAMQEAGWPLSRRLQEFPWFIVDLLLPLLLQWIFVWCLIWETCLNLLAEITYFADRNFYDAWWNSVSYDQFARSWNRPVHNFLLRHVYQTCMSRAGIGKGTATFLTFLLSSLVHELVLWCLFKKLRGFQFLSQMLQVPLIVLGYRLGLGKGRPSALSNGLWWASLAYGTSQICALYLLV